MDIVRGLLTALGDMRFTLAMTGAGMAGSYMRIDTRALTIMTAAALAGYIIADAGFLINIERDPIPRRATR